MAEDKHCEYRDHWYIAFDQGGKVWFSVYLPKWKKEQCNYFSTKEQAEDTYKRIAGHLSTLRLETTL
jgi:hypothetical protein